ncbi:MAG TPA: DNA topoisomerase IB [Solirubrobacterales bacterium]|nr:DNA topoisomerase IB [Solirubrobacterales bacterium]
MPWRVSPPTCRGSGRRFARGPGSLPSRLKRSDCSETGITRRRCGGGFTYKDAHGRRVEDEETLARIRALAIPPAWRDVWICPAPNGHIQATGFDEAGRKQYLYHERWHERAAQRKFEAMRDFAAALPRLRRSVRRDIRADGVPRRRALACAVRLMDLGFLRVGGEEYAEANGSFGVATIRREHVSIHRDEMLFDFPAKSGQRRVQSLRDREARAAVEAMRRRRMGPADLLVYREGGEWRDVRSADVNAYIQAQIGDRFSAKDFRTWHGTVLAAIELAVEGPPASRRAAERSVAAAMKRVAEALGNTPAVCRASYVDPRLLDRFRDGVTISPGAERDGSVSGRTQARVEREVLQLIS